MAKQLPATTSEKLSVFVSTDSDPTGESVAYAVTSGDDYAPQPTSFTAGTWVSGSYSAATGGADSLTPLIGDTGATPAAVIGVVAGTYRLWVRVTSATEAPVIDLGLITFV